MQLQYLVHAVVYSPLSTLSWFALDLEACMLYKRTLGTAAWNWTLVTGVGLVLTMETIMTATPGLGEFCGREELHIP